MTRRTSPARLLVGVAVSLSLAAGIGVAATRPASTSAATAGSAPATTAAAAGSVVQPAGYAAAPAAANAPAGDTSVSSSTTSGTPAAQQVARSHAAPRLHPQRPPSYGMRAPMGSDVILPRGSKLHVYAGPTGKQRLVDLTNPLLPGVPLVLAQEGGVRNHRIPVALPVRPNNIVGWVNRYDVKVRPDHWRIAIYRSKHRLLVWKDQTLMGSFPVAVGKPSTPTPSGIFYLLVKMTSWGDYGPWLMPTSGFSDVYQTFGLNGGDAAIAIHGTNEDSSVGHSISHGCIRMHNRDVSLIAPVLSVGTLVQIH